MNKMHKTNHDQELIPSSNVDRKKYDSIFNYTIKIIYLKNTLSQSKRNSS